jgi:hypothetical protein
MARHEQTLLEYHTSRTTRQAAEGSAVMKVRGQAEESVPECGRLQRCVQQYARQRTAADLCTDTCTSTYTCRNFAHVMKDDVRVLTVHKQGDSRSIFTTTLAPPCLLAFLWLCCQISHTHTPAAPHTQRAQLAESMRLVATLAALVVSCWAPPAGAFAPAALRMAAMTEGTPPVRPVLKEQERLKADPSPDAYFYNYPRLVFHVDK